MQNTSSHLFEFEDVVLITIVDNKSKDSLFLLALCFLYVFIKTIKLIL